MPIRHKAIGIQKWFWYRWIGKVCSFAPAFNFVSTNIRLIEPLQNHEVENGEVERFLPLREDRIN